MIVFNSNFITVNSFLVQYFPDIVNVAFTAKMEKQLDLIESGETTSLEVLTELRKTSQLPVVMLTAKGDEMDRIVGLEIGADDYLSKPCNPRELIARLRAVLRRTKADVLVDTRDVIHIDEKQSA